MSGGYAPKRGDQNDGQGQTDSAPIDSAQALLKDSAKSECFGTVTDEIRVQTK
jgi:hypothetical protein